MPKPFRFGVVTAFATSHQEWITQARKAEDLGYSTLLIPDRLMAGLSVITALAVAAEATKSLRVGSYVFCNDLRNPALLAREMASLDLLSEGRVEVGLGAGVSQQDFEQLGLPFYSAGTRVSRLEEALHIMKLVFTEQVANFSGKHYTIKNLSNLPKPVQKPHPPIFIGSAGKRMLSFAAREANIISPTLKWAGPGASPADVSMEEKVNWIKEAAGERFSQLELAQAVFQLAITDSAVGVKQIQVGGGPTIGSVPMSTEQAVEHLLAMRERYGFSYIHVNGTQLENFAPVIARLAGK
ncbi:TIGR03621 family F420-dependent LLM class oxidoreductase [Ktedonosporobacter rubrisoli]|uniref:TIGR03621 family F420-dependent LLM class oxidoreductase n=1 Tax=Ktedonosporobacter rubrisoli TaxID=2509675 RepID=A0A4P6JR75_KTERU|nr:TIGR03621 family F420-dependent LLM class oxidoreductase [Ktedonosporobacter rubrisoli]QBD77949.1 TIGR03621 family F420-dependent LLM class oxidoreductase [Ktedonosporobacter rubrisoli]